MSNFANLPTHVGLPNEVLVNNIDPIMPPDAKSNSIRVYAINNPTVQGSFTVPAATGQLAEINFPQSDITFDIPVSQSPDTFLDTRLSALNFRVVVTNGTATSTPTTTTAALRSSGYAYFDLLKIISQDGGLLEYFPELGLVCDTVINGTMSNSDKEGMGFMGFASSFGAGDTNTGHDISGIKGVVTANAQCSYNYSLPLMSGVLGVMNDKFFPIGLTKKLLLTLTTAPILPFTIIVGTAGTNAQTVTVQLTDFWLNLETISIGQSAFRQITDSLHDGKIYMRGQTWKTTTGQIPAGTTGLINLPMGITASSCRSLFARFYESGTPGTANSSWGKYDSKGNFNQYGWNIGGQQVPSSLYNPLLYPAQAFRSFLMALGTFNSSQFKCGIIMKDYCKLLAGGSTANADSNYTLSSYVDQQCEFILGENLETIPRRGLLSGQDLTFQKVNLTLSLPSANTNSVTVYCHALVDCITILDIQTGQVVTIL